LAGSEFKFIENASGVGHRTPRPGKTPSDSAECPAPGSVPLAEETMPRSSPASKLIRGNISAKVDTWGLFEEVDKMAQS
jgi:hypothetical protein